MNQSLRALIKRKENFVAMAKNVNDLAASAGRDLFAGEQKQVDTYLAEAEALAPQIKAEEAAIEEARNAPAPVGAQTFGGDGGEAFRDAAQGFAQAAGGRLYADLFPRAARERNPFRSFAEFMRTVDAGMADTRLTAASGASSFVGADGGFLVPTPLVAGLMDASLESEVVRPRAKVFPLESSSLRIAGFDVLDHSTSIGGFTGQWVGEGEQITTQKGKVRTVTLAPHKVAIISAATAELLADGYFENELSATITKALGFYLDSAFLTGTGVGQPLGILNDPAVVTVTKETSQPDGTLIYNNVLAMYGRLHPACTQNAVWIASPSTRPYLMQMTVPQKNVAGTENVGGSWVPVLREGSGDFVMLGLPVVFSEKLPALGTKGDLILADLSQYAVGLRSEITLAKSAHYGFSTDEVYFRLIARADGRGRWNRAVQPKNGSSLSWCVVLGGRP